MPRFVVSLDFTDARRIVDAGVQKAEELRRLYNIAVVDVGGNLLAHVRMDGAWIGSTEIAMRKAWAARAFNMSTEELARLADCGALGLRATTTIDSHVATFGGGVPIVVDGAVIGAVGVCGSTADDDLVVATAAASGFSSFRQYRISGTREVIWP
jgi:uncharacterized protein GlcG (DUF336 family)